MGPAEAVHRTPMPCGEWVRPRNEEGRDPKGNLVDRAGGAAAAWSCFGRIDDDLISRCQSS
jgi:hypothetical protein